MMLKVEGLHVSYGAIKALRGIDLEVEEGEIVALIGANGAGKSTTLRAISGMVPSERGRVLFQGKQLNGMPPHAIVKEGISHVPEGRKIFANLTVAENLKLATYTRRDREGIRADLDDVLSIFPVLKERMAQLGGTLSGGEQQMLAVARALMIRSRLMLLDEPSMGLSPILVSEIFKVLREINRAGTTLLLVEQNALLALKTAHRAYVLETGVIVLAGPAQTLLENPGVKAAYLGG